MSPEWHPIEFSIDETGRPVFAAHDRVRHRLADHDARARCVLEAATAGGGLSLPAPVDVLALHPAAHMLSAYASGAATREEINGAPEMLMHASPAIIDRLASRRVALVQDNGLLPRSEARGARIVVDDTVPSGAGGIDDLVSQIEGRLGDGWKDHVAVIRVATIVKVAHLAKTPYFSGSWSPAFGAAHMSKPKDEQILAETLTHEAAHTWLNLVEECEPLADSAWEENVWVSPWRGDPRPIGGIVHGVFVFSCVAAVLTTYLDPDTTGESEASAIARRRAAYLVCQVREGLAELHRTRRLRASGTWVCRTSEARLDAVVAKVGRAPVAQARDAVAERRQQKLEQWQRDGVTWRA